jgi:hypothetical protein
MGIASSILAALPASLEAISGYASVVPSLRGWYQQFPTALSFINAGVKLYGQASRGVFGEAWRVYQYFINQGQYLNMVDPNDVIDPRLAVNSYVPLSSYDPTAQYRYGVQYQVWMPQQSAWKQFNIWVETKFPTTPEGAALQGLMTLNAYLSKYRLQVEDDTTNQPDVIKGIILTSFTRFLPEE